jgi:LPS sulfotransferase NodH
MIKTITNDLLQKARDVANAAYSLRHEAYRSLGSMSAHRNYTRFIILGRSRSGSNFLRGLLNSHRQVITFGELFGSDAAINWGLFGYPKTSQLLEQFRNDPVSFLESQVFREVPKQIQAVGFKLFYYHAHQEKWQPVWEYLAAQRELKVIHIRRDNLLKLHLSRKRARLTDRWVNLSGAPEQYAPILLDYQECLNEFVQTRKWESEYVQFFANHALLDVHYEALAQNYQGEIGRVQRFLGLSLDAVTPKTHQQSDQPLSASVSNYYELKERFQGTEWQDFFEE